MIDGLIAVWKEQDYTSHDVIAKLRGILHQKKIGHTGTLDPKAEGVLLVGLGAGTRACGLLPDKTKTYEAEVTLGIATDTQDIWGTVEKEETVSVTEESFRNAILSFLGTYLQTPPMYSAKKINGKKLYELARQGKTVERRAVPVTISRIEILSVCADRAVFTVECSEGTYIRTLCADIGHRLGVSACMSRLTRVCAGGFDRSQALTLAQIEQARDEGLLEKTVIPVDRALSVYPALQICGSYRKMLINGNPFPDTALLQRPVQPDGLYRVYLEDGVFIGIFSWSEQRHIFVPYRMFYRTGGNDGSLEGTL